MPNGAETQKQRFPKVWSLESQATEAGAQSEVTGLGEGGRWRKGRVEQGAKSKREAIVQHGVYH